MRRSSLRRPLIALTFLPFAIVVLMAADAPPDRSREIANLNALVQELKKERDAQADAVAVLTAQNVLLQADLRELQAATAKTVTPPAPPATTPPATPEKAP